MRQTIKVSDLTTLFVCPSAKWGTLERRALADSVYFRDIGGNSIIFCLNGSFVDREAKRQDITTIYYSGKKVNRFFDFSYLIDIRKILKENRFNIIHCYDLNYIWNISLLLMTNFEIPLFLTLNDQFQNNSNAILQRWLLRRIDHIFTFCNITSELMREYLPVGPRKIQVTGGGIEVYKKNDLPKISRKIKIRRIGTLINLGVNYYNDISTLLYTISPLVEAAKDLSIELEFYFYSERDWSKLKYYAKICEKIQSLGIEKFVHFEKVDQREVAIQSLNIFVGTSFQEPFNDLEVMALLYFIPVVFPRTASRQETLSIAKFIGESYFQYDARELKSKLLKILINEKVYLSEIIDANEILQKKHGMDSYSELLTKLYELNFAKRHRVSHRYQR